MKLYTKTGDTGESGLFGGTRVPKDDARFHAIGTVDELNAMLGVVIAELGESDPQSSLLQQIQNDLFVIGSHLATPSDATRTTTQLPLLSAERVTFLEQQIDRLDASLPPLREFILPGGVRAAAVLHHARTVCRRAERAVVALTHTTSQHTTSEHTPLNPRILPYLNRLSDLLFVAARAANHQSGATETPWKKDYSGQ